MGLRSFIPQKVNNKLVIGFYDFLRKADKIHHSRQVAKRNYINNQKAMENHQFNSSKEYIEDQHSYDDVKYGCVTVSYAGCEVISIYNAYVYYFGNDAVDFPKLLASFESDGMALNGFFGTAPKSIVHYLEAHGFKTEFYSDADCVNRCEGERCVIFTFYNDASDIMEKVHTICVTREEDGYYAHNVHCNGRIHGPYESLEQFAKRLNGSKAKMINSIIVK